MNFFEHQHRARRRTAVLVGYFALAVITTAMAVSGALYLFLWWASDQQLTLQSFWQSGLLLSCAGITLTLILFGSLRKAWQLRGGGTALASMLRAREISPDASAQEERRYRNVVEEMAIASGIPAPRTFVMDNEPAINAFVAGFRPTEAVVVVTGGTMKELDRDELQGVIAHEFSHIFNADMSLNMRLMAILSGILTIGRVGEFLLRSMSFRGRRRLGRSSGDARGHAFIFVLGLLLMVIGYVGLFFGRLIKAAISRQREFLADASSVQFTRNPPGIAGALIKIRNGSGAGLINAHAEDMSHMCFGQAVNYRLQGLLATHPPVDERLAALGPEWVARARVRARQQPASAPGSATSPESASAFAPTPVPSPAPAPADPASATGQTSPSAGAGTSSPSAMVGTVSSAQMGYAASILSAIPAPLRAQLQQPGSASLMMHALLAGEHRGQQADIQALLGLGKQQQAHFDALAAEVDKLGSRLRLPLIDLALPALKQMPQAERDRFVEQVHALARADNRLSLFQYVLTRILDDHLSANAERNKPVRFRRYSQLENDIQLVFSLLVHVSGARDDQARELFGRSTAVMLSPGRILLPASHCKMARLDQGLANLRDLTPMLKGPLVDAMADLVLEDGKVQVAEAELLRAICTLLDCPVPPLQSAA